MIEPRTIERYRRELSAMTTAATHDPEAFAAVVGLLDEVDLKMQAAAHTLNSDGFSWTDIGRALGLTKQAAHQRYALVPAPE